MVNSGELSYINGFLITQPLIPGPVTHHQTVETPWPIPLIHLDPIHQNEISF